MASESVIEVNDEEFEIHPGSLLYIQHSSNSYYVAIATTAIEHKNLKVCFLNEEKDSVEKEENCHAYSPNNESKLAVDDGKQWVRTLKDAQFFHRIQSDDDRLVVFRNIDKKKYSEALKTSIDARQDLSTTQKRWLIGYYLYRQKDDPHTPLTAEDNVHWYLRNAAKIFQEIVVNNDQEIAMLKALNTEYMQEIAVLRALNTDNDQEIILLKNSNTAKNDIIAKLKEKVKNDKLVYHADCQLKDQVLQTKNDEIKENAEKIDDLNSRLDVAQGNLDEAQGNLDEAVGIINSQAVIIQKIDLELVDLKKQLAESTQKYENLREKYFERKQAYAILNNSPGPPE